MKTHFFARWDHWWTRKVPPHAMAILRIALGLFLMVYALTFFPHLSMTFSNEGIILPLFEPEFSAWFLVPASPVIVGVLFIVILINLWSFTVGFYMRSSILVVLILSLYFWQLNLHPFPTSYNRIFVFLLTVFLFSGADRTFSMRMLAKEGSIFAWEPISILPQRFIALQISFMYLGVGWQKFVLPAWQSGEILAYSFISRWATPPAFWFIRLGIPLWFFDGLVWVTKIFEALIPFGLWIRKVQWWFFVGGALFHILIAVLISIWWFLFLIPAYIVFLKPEDVYEWCKRKSKHRIA